MKRNTFARVAVAAGIAALAAACGGGGAGPGAVLGTPTGMPINALDGHWLWVHETFVADGVGRDMTLAVDAENHVTGTGAWRTGIAAPDHSGPYVGTLTVSGTRHNNDVEFDSVFYFKDQVVDTRHFKGVVGLSLLTGTERLATGDEIATSFQRLDSN